MASPKLIQGAFGKKLYGLIPAAARQSQQWKLIDSIASYAELIAKYENETDETKKTKLLYALSWLSEFNQRETNGLPMKNIKPNESDIERKTDTNNLNASKRCATTRSESIESVAVGTYDMEGVYLALLEATDLAEDSILSKKEYTKMRNTTAFTPAMREFYESKYFPQEGK